MIVLENKSQSVFPSVTIGDVYRNSVTSAPIYGRFTLKSVRVDFGLIGMPSDDIDTKIALSEARSETKMVKLESKIDALAVTLAGLSGKIDAQRTEASSNRNLIIVTVIASVLTFAGLMFAMISYGANTFYNGTVVRDLVHTEVQAARPPSSK